MPKPIKFIKISVKPPSPDWWPKVKRYASEQGMHVGALVVRAITQYIIMHREGNQYPHSITEL